MVAEQFLFLYVTLKYFMKKEMIVIMEDARQNIYQRLKEESEMLTETELNLLLDSLLEIEKILETLRK